MNTATAPIRYQVTGMDCASCAAKIEGAARKVEGVNDVKVSIASQIMTLRVDDAARRLPVLRWPRVWSPACRPAGSHRTRDA